MGLFQAIEIAASGLTAERLRMDVTAENLANAQTTRTPAGGPYRRQEVILAEVPTAVTSTSFASALRGAEGELLEAQPAAQPASPEEPGAVGGIVGGGVAVAGIVESPTPNQLVYDPSNPEANAQGYVQLPNVNPVTEMTNLIAESRAYEADVTAIQTAKDMYNSTLSLLK
jgi:flagellar basal-body rod protein FlgC